MPTHEPRPCPWPESAEAEPFKLEPVASCEAERRPLARRWYALLSLLVGWLSSATAQTSVLNAPQVLNLAEALDRYATLTGRTVLRPGDLPHLPNAITNQLPADTNLAAAWIVGELSRNDIEVVPDGTMFAQVLTAEKKTPALEAQLAALGPVPFHDSSGASNRISFPSVDLGTFFEFYGDLTGRTLLRAAGLPATTLHLQTRRPLTHGETVYALKTILTLNGIALVDDGAKLAQVVPLAERSMVRTNAPAPERGADLIDPSAIQAFAVASALAPPPSSLPVTVDRLISYYASLTGLKAVASPQFGKLWVSFRVRNSLTKPELLYALETTLALNNLAIMRVDDQTIRVGPLSAGRRAQSDSLPSSSQP